MHSAQFEFLCRSLRRAKQVATRSAQLDKNEDCREARNRVESRANNEQKSKLKSLRFSAHQNLIEFRFLFSSFAELAFVALSAQESHCNAQKRRCKCFVLQSCVVQSLHFLRLYLQDLSAFALCNLRILENLSAAFASKLASNCKHNNKRKLNASAENSAFSHSTLESDTFCILQLASDD